MSEYLIFDGVTLDGPIECEDLGVLRNMVFRGKNRLYPGASGRRPLRLVMDELEETLVWFVRGTPDVNGDPQDPEDGLVANREFYWNLFGGGGDGQTSEHEIVLHMADFVFDGTLQVVEYAQPRTGPQTATILTLVRVPSGVLQATGS